jgi:hypothetical protein
MLPEPAKEVLAKYARIAARADDGTPGRSENIGNLHPRDTTEAGYEV